MNKGSGVGIQNNLNNEFSLLDVDRGLLKSDSSYIQNPLIEQPTSLTNPNGGWLENKSPYMDSKNWNTIGSDNNYVNGMNSAKADMIAQGASAAGELTGAIVGGVLQKKDNENARNEAKELANITREDTLKQQNIELSFRKKQIEQEEQQMQLQQMRETINRRFSIWQNKFQREIQNISKARQAAVEFKQKYMQLDEEKRRQIVRGMV